MKLSELFEIIDSNMNLKSVLKEMKCADLTAICSDFGLKKSGRKAELIDRINAFIHSQYQRQNKHEYVIGADSVVRYIVEHDLHVSVSRAIIRRIAGNPNERNATMAACLAIVNSNFSDVIFDDITQGIAETLITMAQEQAVYIQNGHLKCTDATFEDSTYLRLYKSLYSTLKTYGRNANQMIHEGNEAIVYWENDNGVTEEHVINEHSALYQSALAECAGLKDCERIAEIKGFFKWLAATHSEKVARDCLNYVIGRFNGLSKDEIIDRYKIKRSTLTLRIALLRSAYQEYKDTYNSAIFVGKDTCSATYGGYVKNVSYAGGFSYGGIIFDFNEGTELDKLLASPSKVNPLWQGPLMTPTMNAERTHAKNRQAEREAELKKWKIHGDSRYSTLEARRQFAVSMAHKKGTLPTYRPMQILKDRTVIIR